MLDETEPVEQDWRGCHVDHRVERTSIRHYFDAAQRITNSVALVEAYQNTNDPDALSKSPTLNKLGMDHEGESGATNSEIVIGCRIDIDSPK